MLRRWRRAHHPRPQLQQHAGQIPMEPRLDADGTDYVVPTASRQGQVSGEPPCIAERHRRACVQYAGRERVGSPSVRCHRETSPRSGVSAVLDELSLACFCVSIVLHSGPAAFFGGAAALDGGCGLRARFQGSLAPRAGAFRRNLCATFPAYSSLIVARHRHPLSRPSRRPRGPL
ncbi:hypothetical protein HPB50_014071 [Hyalomma asiaticum]|uniref:Uncharacterized protein n=1 Tax=Hyalomma asiaticum TaxID=266040 RepID=A0ACB7S8S2_HYAAI|nr:hypothetical protein HPB50_014071 [Hyalomma asiaticum]